MGGGRLDATAVGGDRPARVVRSLTGRRRPRAVAQADGRLARGVRRGRRAVPPGGGAGHGLAHGPLRDVLPLLRDPGVRRAAPAAPSAEEFAAALADPEVRRSIVSWTPPSPAVAESMEKAYGRTYVLGDPPDYEPGPERSLAGLAAAQGVSPLEVAYDEMARDGGNGLLYLPILNYSTATSTTSATWCCTRGTARALGRRRPLRHDLRRVMPTFMLTHWTRDRTRGATLPLEYIVKKQTHDTARLYGMSDRGTVEPGRWPTSTSSTTTRRRSVCRSCGPTCRPVAAACCSGRRGMRRRSRRRRDLRGRRADRGTARAAGARARAELGRAHGGRSPAGRLQRVWSAADPVRRARRRAYRLSDVGPRARPDTVDVLEFNNGLMIRIDETVDEPNWLRYTERVGAFSRLIRFDAGGLGLSDPLPSGRPPSRGGPRCARRHGRRRKRSGRGHGVDGWSMAALWLAAHTRTGWPA